MKKLIEKQIIVLILFSAVHITLLCAGKNQADAIITAPISSGYLAGKLPGKRWLEHNPPQYGALQSFELRNSSQAFFFLTKGQTNISLKEQLAKLIKLRKAKASEIMQEENLVGEGLIWLRYTVSQPSGVTRLYLTKTDDANVFWIIYFAKTDEAFALYAPDVQYFVRNLTYSGV